MGFIIGYVYYFYMRRQNIDLNGKRVNPDLGHIDDHCFRDPSKRERRKHAKLNLQKVQPRLPTSFHVSNLITANHSLTSNQTAISVPIIAITKETDFTSSISSIMEVDSLPTNGRHILPKMNTNI